jgi:hypothetical protein
MVCVLVQLYRYEFVLSCTSDVRGKREVNT